MGWSDDDLKRRHQTLHSAKTRVNAWLPLPLFSWTQDILFLSLTPRKSFILNKPKNDSHDRCGRFSYAIADDHHVFDPYRRLQCLLLLTSKNTACFWHGQWIRVFNSTSAPCIKSRQRRKADIYAKHKQAISSGVRDKRGLLVCSNITKRFMLTIFSLYRSSDYW